MKDSSENESEIEELASRQERRFNSVEAEQELVSRYSILRNHPAAQVLFRRKIGDYWDTEGLRAPFIEPLTVRELLSLSVDNLLKKKNFREGKLIGLISALDRLLADEVSEESLAAAPVVTQQVAIPPLSHHWSLWKPLSESSAAIIDRWIAARSFFYREKHSSSWILGEFVRELPHLIDPDEFLVFLADLNSESPEVAGTHEDLRKYFERNHQDLLQWFSTSLKGVGTAEKALQFPLLYQKGEVADEYFPHLPLSCLRIILSVLGAQHPKLDGESLVGVWTTDPESFSHVLTAARAHESPEKQLETLQALAPHFPDEVLNRCVCS